MALSVPSTAVAARRFKVLRWLGWLLLGFLLLYLLPVGLSGAGFWLDEERRVLR